MLLESEIKKKINWKGIKKINRINLDQPVKPATRSWDYDSLTESKLKKTWSPIKRKRKKMNKANQPNLQLDHKIGIIPWKVNKKNMNLNFQLTCLGLW
jgi:hypothetical protein